MFLMFRIFQLIKVCSQVLFRHYTHVTKKLLNASIRGAGKWTKLECSLIFLATGLK